MSTSLEHGLAVIKKYVKTLPNSPGVYRMLDEGEEVLYVGKALSLQKRVSSYTRATGHTTRILRMIARTVAMEFITTPTEADALLLEANLIKRYQPAYNVLLRDAKSMPYILIKTEHEFAELTKHRGARKKQGHYYGPFASAGAVNRTLNILQRAFMLRTCTDSVFENRQRPCLLYQIKRCSGPCTGEISVQDYGHLVGQTKNFLSSKSQAVNKDLARKMEAASKEKEYEQAAIYRDRISALSQIQAHQGINPKKLEEADLFALTQIGGRVCVQAFFFRNHQNWGNRAFFPRLGGATEPADILQAFIAQFYDNKPCPKRILLSEPVRNQTLLAEALSNIAGYPVAIEVPKRGEKYLLMQHALENAKNALERKAAETESQERLLNALAELLDLEQAPRRIEVYDNSHISGSNAVGGMIVAGPEGFMKTSYRTFNIKDKDTTPGDDFAMMREVLKRRFTRMIKEQSTRPDLVIIDGGKGQLSATHEVMADLGVGDIPLLAISKGPDRNAGREKLHYENKASFQLGEKDPLLYFLQRLRDEAHRFAIGTHRARRKKNMTQSPLDEIEGIGAKRKKALLNHFGSARAVSSASAQDLEVIDGISRNLAKLIYDHFHERRD